MDGASPCRSVATFSSEVEGLDGRGEVGRTAKALAHPTRREILARLVGSGLADRKVGRALGGPALPLVGYHLGVLERAGLVRRVSGVFRLR